MKTSEEIYNRIMTDPNLNKSLFVMVYRDVIKKKYIDVPAVKWLPVSKGGDVPYHRVDFIKFDGKIIWDRSNKLCTIEECIINTVDEVLPDNFKITTFNVLSDEYEKQITNITKRLDNLLSYIFSDVDIICLQEVQPSLLVEIKQMATTLNRYVAHTTIGINDVVIVSKIKFIFSEYISLGQQKGAIRVDYKIGEDTDITIIGVHLTSDHHDDNSKKRTEQLYKIKQKLIGKSNVILLGDTNNLTYEHNLSHFLDYTDCWIDLNQEKCFTYNPLTNSLAFKIATNKTPLRLDRILYTKNNTLNCNSIILDISITFSDHYALTANFVTHDKTVTSQVADISKTTNQTALCIIPPYELWETINRYKISSESNVQESRWMPHLNLFFGFTQPEYFYEIHKNISKLNLKSFEIEFNKLAFFHHEKNFTLFLQPSVESVTKLRMLYSKLNSSDILKLACFDAKTIFNPHIALGNTDDQQKILSAMKQHVNIKFEIANLSFVSRIGLEYFKVVRNVNMKTYPMNFYINFVKTISTMLNTECHVCGSRIFGIVDYESDTDSDADLLCVGNQPRNVFFSKASKIFDTCGYFRKIVVVKNKYVFCLKLKTNDSNIDIQYVNSNDTDENYYKSGLAILNEPKFMIKQLDSLISGSKLELFKECLNWTKTKLKQQHMYSSIHCFVGGMSVAIIVGTIVKIPTVINLESYQNALKEYDFNTPIHMGNTSAFKNKNPCDRLLYIGTSTPPIENTARHICKSTAFLLKSQLSCAFDETNFSQLCAKFAKIITFKIIAIDDESLEDCMTWFNGIVTTMMVAIERNSKDIVLWPATKWNVTKTNEQLEAIWTLKSTEDYASLYYTSDKVIEKSKTLFSSCYVSYS